MKILNLKFKKFSHFSELILNKFKTNTTTNDALLYAQLIFTTKSNIGWVKGSAFPTGWAVLFLMLFVYIFTIPFFRRRGYYEVC